MLPHDAGKPKRRRASAPVSGRDRPPVPCPPVPLRPLRNRDFPPSARRRRSVSVPERRVNCVLVGDGAVGKTSLVVSYTTNGYPTEYVPTAFDNYTVMVVVDGKAVRLQLCDMAGQDDLSRLRLLCYRGADVFLLCYSVVRPSSLRGLAERWAPQVRRQRPDAPLVLVGTQLDLLRDAQVLVRLAACGERPVGAEQARRLARRIGAVGLAECSALTQENLKDAFDVAILAGVRPAEAETEATPRRKTLERTRSLSEAWWRKISCLMGEKACGAT